MDLFQDRTRRTEQYIVVITVQVEATEFDTENSAKYCAEHDVAASSDNIGELITDNDKGFEQPKHVLKQRRCQEAQQHRRKVGLKVHHIKLHILC